MLQPVILYNQASCSLAKEARAAAKPPLFCFNQLSGLPWRMLTHLATNIVSDPLFRARWSLFCLPATHRNPAGDTFSSVSADNSFLPAAIVRA